MSLIDEAREIKDWINSDDPCDTGDLEPDLVLQMCNRILAKPKRSKKTTGVWQITEERKAAIWHAIAALQEDDVLEDPDEDPLWDNEIAMLRAMLKEAGQ